MKLQLRNLKSQGLPAEDLQEVHRVKKKFDGQVIPSAGVEKIQIL